MPLRTARGGLVVFVKPRSNPRGTDMAKEIIHLLKLAGDAFVQSVSYVGEIMIGLDIGVLRL